MAPKDLFRKVSQPRERKKPLVVRLLPMSLERKLAKLPFEDRVASGLNRVARAINESPPTRLLTKIQEKAPRLPELIVPTPLGTVGLPEISLPTPGLPQFNERKRKALKAAIGSDLGSLIGLIPVIGDAAGDLVEDMYGAEIRGNLTEGEYEQYKKWDKIGPSTMAMIRTFIQVRD